MSDSPREDDPATPDPEIKIELGFSTLEGYRHMGSLIATARDRLGLPRSATPTEVVFAALDATAAEGGGENPADAPDQSDSGSKEGPPKDPDSR